MRYTSRHLRTRLKFLPLEDRLAPAVFTVANADDAGTGSLRQAVLDANAATGSDAIVFDTSFFNVPRTINLTSGDLLIADALAITGPGADLLTVRRDAAAATNFRVFTVDAPGVQAVTLTNLTVSGGSTTGPSGTTPNGDGGGLLLFNDLVTLDRVVVTGNTSGTEGGGIAVATTTAGGAGSLFLRNSAVTGNTATGAIGPSGFGGGGGGIYFANGGSLVVENSTISGNTSVNYDGGGVYFFGAIGANGLAFRNSTVAGNTSGGDAGGLYLRATGGTALVQNCTIASNTSGSGNGGGIGVFGASTLVTLSSTVVAFNTGAAAPDVFGPLAADTSLIRDTNGATITDNGGNLLPNTDPLFVGGATPTLADNGGPTQTIALQAGSPLLNVGSNPANLLTDQRGPGFARTSGAGTDIGAFELLPVGIPTAGGTFSNLTTAAPTYTFQVTYTDDTAIDVSTIGANDIRVTGPNGYDQAATFVTIDNPTNGTPRTATYSITGPGGAAFAPAANGTYTVLMQPNAVADTSANFVTAGSLGSFQVLLAGTYTVTNADDTGPGSLRAALEAIGAFQTPGDAIVFDPAFFSVPRTIGLMSGDLLVGDGVTITGPGAGLLTVRRDPSAATNFRVFTIDVPGVQAISISGMTISGGSTTGPSGTTPNGDGGGLLLFNDLVTLDRVVVTGNTSGTEGGGIAVATTTAGGAGSLFLRNSAVTGNTATGAIGPSGFGGGGGGIYFANGGSLVVENSTISGNTSLNYDGGGLYFFGAIGANGLVIRNSTVAGNTAGGDAGGLYLRATGGTGLVQNCTIASNTSGSGNGGGIGVFGASTLVTLSSTVVAFNTGAAAPDVFGPVAADTSLIRDTNGATITDNGGNLAANTDPLFVGGATPTLADNGGPTQTIALQTGSPLLNVGSNPANLTTDQRGPGFARTSGAGTDIGAFEAQSATAPTVVANGVRVNSGQANTTQRSRVTSIDVEFSTVVTFAGPVANAFLLSRIGGGAVGGFTATANTVAGHTVVTLNAFTGAETQFGSLADGRYQLTAVANQITAGGLQLDGDGNGTGGDNFVLNGTTANGLFRFFGDVNGDGTDNAADFGPFRAAFGTSTGNPLYRDFLDFNADNTINAADFAQFRSRFGASVP